MLVLSRKVGEQILIGDNISVTVVRIAPDVVRLGIEAPDHVPIVRDDIKNQMRVVSADKGSALRSTFTVPIEPGHDSSR
jgi:carbon storage regulator